MNTTAPRLGIALVFLVAGSAGAAESAPADLTDAGRALEFAQL